MKKAALLTLNLIVLLLITACNNNTGFTGVEISGDRIISGSVQNGNVNEHRILVYLIGGRENGWQPAEFGGPLFIFQGNGSFEIKITDDTAKEVMLYLAPKNIDYTYLQTMDKQKLDRKHLKIPASVPDEPGPDGYVIRYALNDGTDEYMTNDTIKAQGQSVKLSENEPQRSGFTFLGWNPDPDASEIKYAPGANYSADGNAILYAVWKAVPSDMGSAPEPFVLLKDDGAPQDAYENIAFMGSDNNGDDGSLSVNEYDANEKIVGEASMKFSYTAPGGRSHWSGVMLLFFPGFDSGAFHDDPGDKGPDLTKYQKMTFYAKGSGGVVKFFIECDGGSQSTTFVKLEEDWQKITLEIKDSWKYCNIPFGWACNESNPEADGVVIEFWVDGMQFE